MWLYSASKKAWVAFVPCGCGEQWSLKPHPCKHAQDGAMWKQIRRGTRPHADYLAAKKALKSAPTTEETS